ncbi:alpha/beta hydrolase [Rhodococcus globerulus]|uniref:alpha/beta hydrolase n=1 Tax=Rhodococcus globerulus TaxID=33008 RepID=UPI001F1F5936|nr:alpha/beta hydrolase [Rhodococcus globerulus]MCE4267348.1 alpha/beta hydrolase [Rhodococcus globerulus]
MTSDPVATDFDPALKLARFLPRTVITRQTAGLLRRLTGLGALVPPKGGEVVRCDANVSVRVFRPTAPEIPRPGVLFIHGGGYLIGSAAMGDGMCRNIAAQLGAVAASVEYRLAPHHPYPAPLEDCYRALRWLADQPDVDSSRIAVVGESAGGGLAAALTLLAKERGEVLPAFQLLSYPMLDDRTTKRTDLDESRFRVWSPRSNRYGWSAYLGSSITDVPPLAAPARYEDLTGLPPTWIGVGTNDLFYDEDVSYSKRLIDAGVPCTLFEVPGAYHGFDQIEARSTPARDYRREQLKALAAVLST